MPSGPATLLALYGLGRVLNLPEVTPAADLFPDDERTELATQAVAACMPPPIQRDTVSSSGASAQETSPEFPAEADIYGPREWVPEPLQTRRWIRHRVRPKERINQIAARYGVSRNSVVIWNGLPHDAVYPRGRRVLRVRARIAPPPRYKTFYEVQSGDTWESIAANFRVETPDLKTFNWKYRRPLAGTSLVVWVDPAAPKPPLWHTGAVPPHGIEVRKGAQSIGFPQAGTIKRAVPLPPSDLYTVSYPWMSWGSTHALQTIADAFATFRHRTRYDGEIVLGGISRRRGGPFEPHQSHQSGRDVDIHLPTLAWLPQTAHPNSDEIDWFATLGLVYAFIETEQVRFIFLNGDLHYRVYDAASMIGLDLEPIRKVLRAEPGHIGHIHVRIKCARYERKCKERRASPLTSVPVARVGGKHAVLPP